MRMFGFALLNYKMWTGNSASGVSLKTLELYALTFFTRLLSILRHQGYLPFDQTGDWFYHFVEIMSFLAVGMAIYGIFGPLISTYAEKHDRFGNLHVPSEFGTVYLVVPCVVIALIFHPYVVHDFYCYSNCHTSNILCRSLQL